MKVVNIRELTHHFASYLSVVKKGERIVVLERSIPVADIVPHNENVSAPVWKRRIEKIQIKGESLSETTARLRAEQR